VSSGSGSPPSQSLRRINGQFVTLEPIRSKEKYIAHFNIIKLRSGSCNYLLICIFKHFFIFFYPPNPRHPRSLFSPSTLCFPLFLVPIPDTLFQILQLNNLALGQISPSSPRQIAFSKSGIKCSIEALHFISQ